MVKKKKRLLRLLRRLLLLRLLKRRLLTPLLPLLMLPPLLMPLLMLPLLLTPLLPPLTLLLRLLLLPSNSGSRNEKPAFWPVFFVCDLPQYMCYRARNLSSRAMPSARRGRGCV